MKLLSRLDAEGPLRDMLLVAVGLVAVGGGSAGALAIAARALPASSFAVFATWATVANLGGLAFVVVEMYLPRLLLSRRAAGLAERPLLVTFTLGTVTAAALLAVAILASAPWSVSALFDGDHLMLALVPAYTVGMALQTLQRGVAVGRGRFPVFCVQMVVDGSVRLGGSLVLLLSDIRSARGFAIVLVAAATAGVAAGARHNGGWWAWRGPRAAVAVSPLGLLALTSLGPLVVNNATVPWLAAGSSVSPQIVGAVAGALTLSRIPTLLVGAAYGPVLAPLAQAVDARDAPRYRRIHRQVWWGAVGAALLFVLAFAWLGPPLLQWFLGPSYGLSRLQLAGMAAGSGLMFVCVVEQAALVALAAWSRSAVAWAAGLVGFGVALVLPIDHVARAVLALVLAPLTAGLVMGVARLVAERAAFPAGTD